MDRAAADRVDDPQFHHAFTQQRQRPAGSPIRWLTARYRNQVGLRAPVKFARTRCSSAGLALQRGLEAFQNSSLPDAFHRRGAHTQVVLDLLVGQAFVGLQKNLSTLQLELGNAVPMNDLLQAGTFIFGQIEDVALPLRRWNTPGVRWKEKSPIDSMDTEH